MMRESKTKEINGTSYTVTQLGAKAGRSLMFRIAKALAAAGGDGANVVDGLREEDFDYACDTFAKFTTVSTAPGRNPCLADIFEEHFAGKYGAMVKWLGFCIEVNYSSFLEDLGIDRVRLQAKVSGLISQTTSTGESGG